MDFDIAKFVEHPTVEGLENCRKADLLQIADYFQIDVVRSGTRQAIKSRLIEALLELEVLPALHGTRGIDFRGYRGATF